MTAPAAEIVCVDCGGRCFLLTPPPEDGRWEVGEIVAYRCEDCRDRWDVELTADDLDGADLDGADLDGDVVGGGDPRARRD